MPKTQPNPACQGAWDCIAAREFRDWNGLPTACGYSDFDAVFARLRDEYGIGKLGRACRPAMFRMHVAEPYPHNLRVWFREDALILIEIMFPTFPYPAGDLKRHFGEPEIRLDYHLDIRRVPRGAWIYPHKGAALFLDAEDGEIMRLALFHPCSLGAYLQEVHTDPRLRELPLDALGD